MIAGLVLAAGAGLRFGSGSNSGLGSGGKLLADLDGRPLLEWAVAAACAVPALERVVVVLGSRADQVLDAVRLGRAEPVVCAEWSLGQAASLRCGLRALEGCSKVMVTLGDEPLITPEAIARLVDEPGGTRAAYGGKPGHPVVLGREQISALAGLSGDRGARDLLRGGPMVEVGHLGCGRDVDTPDDLEAIRDEARAVI